MPSSTEHAVRQLEAALQSLEFAVEQRLSQAASADGLAEQVQMLTADRAELAESLDKAEARAAKLDHANRDVGRRLDAAIASIREILQAEEDA